MTANFFQQASAAAWDVAAQAAGLDAEYVRDDVCIPMRVIPGNSEHEAVDAAGYVARFKQLDFTIKASSLIYFGEQLLPERGDQLVVGSKTYNITPLDGELAPYSEADAYGVILRVHVTLTEDTSR